MNRVAWLWSPAGGMPNAGRRAARASQHLYALRPNLNGTFTGRGDPLLMDLISIGIALVVFVALYFLIDGLDRI